jgi:hypothetical protein
MLGLIFEHVQLNTFKKEPVMNPTVLTYIAYLALSIGLTVWVARTLFKSGAYFLEEALGNKELAGPRSGRPGC